MTDRLPGESQRRILERLKRRGSGTVPALAGELGLNVETVRAHLRALGSEGWVRRAGRRRDRPGRPEVVYVPTEAAGALFPNREDELVRELASYLVETGREEVLRSFFERRVELRRAPALARVDRLEGDERLEEVARILTEDGFMAEAEPTEAGRRVLRLCHCPLRGVVGVTRAPCAAELAFVRELLDERMRRLSYIPSGDDACAYAVE